MEVGCVLNAPASFLLIMRKGVLLTMTIVSYRVQAGDSLWTIANAFNTTPEAIARLNGILADNIIITGQVLRIPKEDKPPVAKCICASTGLPAEPPAEEPPVDIPPEEMPPEVELPMPMFYQVEKGDTLWGISRRFNTTVPKLVELNNIPNPNCICVGQMIRTN